MKQSKRTSVALTEDEDGILEAIAKRLNISRSEAIRHLVLYQGMVGGDFPLTTKILALPEANRAKVVRTIREKCEAGDFVKPSAFYKYLAEAVGSAEADAIDEGIDKLVRFLLAESKKPADPAP